MMKPKAMECRVAGVILAGGGARRMGGIPKGMLRIGGRISLVERLVVHMLRSGIEEIVISANDGSPYADTRCPVISDGRTDVGPLAGIETALEHFTGKYDAVLCVPCDVPALSTEEMRVLLDAFLASGVPVVAAETADGTTHPLCAVIRTDVRKRISAALDRGIRGVGDLWRLIGYANIRFEQPCAFTNLNSPDDVEAWLAIQASLARAD